MLNKLELTYFRRHEHLIVNFTEGLQVIRAVNEGGKTTLLESASYALFGTKSLRTSLENAVTWGHKDTELKVDLEIEVGGQVYLFRRSKKGAEVVINDEVYVTGQNEVSTFAAKLLGADASTAANLMFASQGGLRGALENGPKATATLIEGLAGFDIFDRILDAAQEKLPLGSTAVLEDRVKTLSAQAEAIVVPEKPDAEAHAAKVAEAETVINTLNRMLVEETTPTHDRIYKAWSEECTRRERGRQITADLSKVVSRISETNGQRGQLQPVAGQQSIEIGPLHSALLGLNEQVEVFKAYEVFKGLPENDSGSRADAEKLERDQSSKLMAAERAKTEASMAKKVAESKLVSSSTCSFCGMDVSQMPKTAEVNAQIQVDIQAYNEAVRFAEAEAECANKVLNALTLLHQLDDKAQRAARPILKWVSEDNTVIPVKYTWKGVVPAELDPNTEQRLRAELKSAENHNAAVGRAKAQVEILDQQLGDLNVEQKQLEAGFNGLKLLPESDYQTLETDYLTISRRKQETEECILKEQTNIAQMRTEFDSAMLAHESAARQRDSVKVQVATAEKDITDIQFNNLLLKKIRAARPIVGNKLWNLVLASVSNLFTKMRGETSIVSKGEGGFLVNGQAVESLSGSTLDLLGLAIRTALIKTFLPECPLLVLDEPCAAMDDGRTANLLGFVAAAGFSQVILVTHEETSAALSDNLIQL